MTQSYKKDFLLLFLVILGFFCIGLGERAYITPSEARYIEIPRQMLVTGDWLTPHINGVQYFEKPPLFYWIQAFFLQFGDSEFYGRIATTIIVTLTCLATYATGRLLYGRRAGVLAAFALATSILGYGLSRVAMLDAPVTLFLTCAIASFLFAQKTGKARFYYLMYAFAALAMMTKGLIGIVIPALVIGSWIALTKNWSIILKVKIPTGLLLFLAIAAPWHILMQMQHQDFFDFYFIHEHFTRFLTTEHKRTAPWWFFIAITLAGSFPYILVIPAKAGIQKIRNLLDTDFRWYDKLLLLWIIIPLIFFSSSHSKLVPYIFPIFPPLFVLIGARLDELWEHRKKLIICMMAVMAVVCISANFVAGMFDKRTIKPLTDILKPQLENDDLVVAYNSYWQDLPVYLNRNIIVAGWMGELAFGVERTPHAKDFMISLDEFWVKCAEAKTKVYVFINEGDFNNLSGRQNCPLREMGRYGKTILLQKDIK